MSTESRFERAVMHYGRQKTLFDESDHPREEDGKFAEKQKTLFDAGPSAKKKPKTKTAPVAPSQLEQIDHDLKAARIEPLAEQKSLLAGDAERPHTHWKGDLAEYTGDIRDGFYVIQLMEGPQKGKEVLTIRGPDGHNPNVEKHQAEYKQQQMEFSRLHQHNKPVDQIPAKYADAKKKHPGALILMPVGDFYEAYGDDAKKLAKICGLAVTTMNKGPNSTAMVGFPMHSSANYLKKLIHAGERVAML